MPEAVEGNLEKINGITRSPKKLIKLLVILAILLIQVGSSYFLIIKFLVANPKIVTRIKQKEKEKKILSEKKEFGEIYTLEDIIINPAGTEGKRYLAVSIGLELNNKKLKQEVAIKEPLLLDQLISLLSSKKLLFLVDITQRDSLRNEMLRLVNSNLKEGQVTEVYLTKYILQ